MIFPNYPPAIHAQGSLEFLVNTRSTTGHSEPPKYTCKSCGAAKSEYNTNLKMYNTQVFTVLVKSVTFRLSPAGCTRCSVVSKLFLNNNCRRTDNTRTGTEIVNPYIMTLPIQLGKGKRLSQSNKASNFLLVQFKMII